MLLGAAAVAQRWSRMTGRRSAVHAEGLDPPCDKTACKAANCCGVHIHEGMTCSYADAIGGHFWSKDVYTEDPWMDICYVIEGSMPSKVNDLNITAGSTAGPW